MTRDRIVKSFIRTLFVQAYADFAEETEVDVPRASGGEDWMDVAPNTSAWAEIEALKCLSDLEKTVGPLESLYAKCLSECKALPKPCKGEHDPEGFGHYVAMQYVGHGVSWRDDHPTLLELPYGEFNISSLEEAGLPEESANEHQ